MNSLDNLFIDDEIEKIAIQIKSKLSEKSSSRNVIVECHCRAYRISSRYASRHVVIVLIESVFYTLKVSISTEIYLIAKIEIMHKKNVPY